MKNTRTLAEQLVEQLLEIPMLEMGSERTATRGYARDRSHGILFHLLYIVDRPQNLSVSLWKREVVGKVLEIFRRTNRLRRNFSAEEYREYLGRHVHMAGTVGRVHGNSANPQKSRTRRA